jgi:hypothetical protein
VTASGRRLGRAASVIAGVAAIFGAPASARAGAWTLPEGTGQLIETLYGWTGAGAPFGGNPAVKQTRVDLQTTSNMA